MKTIKLCDSSIYFELPQKLEFEGSVLLISDTNVAPLFLDLIAQKINAPQIHTLVLASGESQKCLKTLEQILNVAFSCKLDRQSTMIALGGGVISDLVGLASGIFMRGIDFVNIPTTLLAQVDASVGGKCGINTQEGKNLIGLFHSPKSVYISPMFLETLAPREWNAGMAEVIKIATCLDERLFDTLFEKQQIKQNPLEVIHSSIKLKADIVRQDPFEKDKRAVLNYGHTFGHIIEKENNYTRYLHGEAVSLGMILANQLAQRLLGFAHSAEVRSLLSLYDLPTHYTITNPQQFLEALFLDKKTKNHQINFILPTQIGSYQQVSPSQEEILTFLSEQY
ncbi:3-dehydroquinate synthase [Helicobacter enhydrae]|uniref:3-dehydroquinate synthase n=1 Tax=Helicobacter enhydrae TaxID=222136 RepID=A0A1B1U3V1_9HELI|nr:3-dehydroquinate synthase [Helicobacter enhydrae]ANV97402.1 3-dehydroquinate synthase [Helicobacter enhydrae]